MNGCHSTLTPDNRQHDMVILPKYRDAWPYVFTRNCQYDKKQADSGCDGCSENVKINQA